MLFAHYLVNLLYVVVVVGMKEYVALICGIDAYRRSV